MVREHSLVSGGSLGCLILCNSLTPCLAHGPVALAPRVVAPPPFVAPETRVFDKLVSPFASFQLPSGDLAGPINPTYDPLFPST